MCEAMAADCRLGRYAQAAAEWDRSVRWVHRSIDGVMRRGAWSEGPSPAALVVPGLAELAPSAERDPALALSLDWQATARVCIQQVEAIEVKRGEAPADALARVGMVPRHLCHRAARAAREFGAWWGPESSYVTSDAADLAAIAKLWLYMLGDWETAGAAIRWRARRGGEQVQDAIPSRWNVR